MPLAPRLAFMVFAAYGVAALVYAVRRRSRRWAALTLVALTIPLLSLPLVLPSEQRVLRFVFAVMGAGMFAKLCDQVISRSPPPDLRRFVAFLLNPTTLVLRCLDAEPHPSSRESARRVLVGLAQLGLGLAALAAVYRFGPGRLTFAAEHVLKVMTLWAGLLGALDAFVSLFRLVAGKARDPMHNIFLARTPADFWRRYNRSVGQFFHEDVWKKVGGMRSPVRATLLVFAASSLLHEYVFGIAIGAVQGYQTAFFMLQGIGVALTLRVHPRGPAAVAWILGTAVFNLASSVLFLISAHQVMPFWWAPPFTP